MSDSSFPLPIFISSPEYNLTDLRAELGHFLENLGYSPMLSSEEGFADFTPELTPWESCLPSLSTCYFVILVIDGRYGGPLEWKSYKDIISEKISPTHGEYRFAHSERKRMLVFVRKGLLDHYQTYRHAMKACKNNIECCKQKLEGTMPGVDFSTLEFIHEVKTSDPIPWIKEFKNVVDIKSEIQKKLLNELANVFMFKQKHIDAVLHAFEQVIIDMPDDKREEALKKIGATSEMLKTIDELTKQRDQIELKHLELQAELKKVKGEKKEAIVKETRQLVDHFVDLNRELGVAKNTFFKSIDFNRDASGSKIVYTDYLPATRLSETFPEWLNDPTPWKEIKQVDTSWLNEFNKGSFGDGTWKTVENLTPQYYLPYDERFKVDAKNLYFTPESLGPEKNTSKLLLDPSKQIKTSDLIANIGFDLDGEKIYLPNSTKNDKTTNFEEPTTEKAKPPKKDQGQ